MIIGSILFLTICTFILFSIIGVFHKKVGRIMKMINFYIIRLRLTRRNINKLPKTAKKFYPVLRHRRGLFLKKLFQNYQKNHPQKKIDRK